MISGPKPRIPRIEDNIELNLSPEGILRFLFQIRNESFLSYDDEEELGEERMALLREIEKQWKYLNQKYGTGGGSCAHLLNVDQTPIKWAID